MSSICIDGGAAFDKSGLEGHQGSFSVEEWHKAVELEVSSLCLVVESVVPSLHTVVGPDTPVVH